MDCWNGFCILHSWCRIRTPRWARTLYKSSAHLTAEWVFPGAARLYPTSDASAAPTPSKNADTSAPSTSTNANAARNAGNGASQAATRRARRSTTRLGAGARAVGGANGNGGGNGKPSANGNGNRERGREPEPELVPAGVLREGDGGDGELGGARGGVAWWLRVLAFLRSFFLLLFVVLFFLFLPFYTCLLPPLPLPRAPQTLRHVPSSLVLKQPHQLHHHPSPPSPGPSRIPALTRRASHAQLQLPQTELRTRSGSVVHPGMARPRVTRAWGGVVARCGARSLCITEGPTIAINHYFCGRGSEETCLSF
ncbi:hypothetical protein B0H17DRAFT_1131821 [Mycena rosella]|uniref:Uncharacterized protein n=1 Tax=Mycena rosella TaxID=1033263 RepID=A0AAD7DM39_MYCRO|nr:hypothetical protein B0H17DRAFT_1131821 [Mycena rosella]